MLPLAIGLGLGAISGLQKQKAAERDRQLQAQTAQWSPWTNMSPQRVQEAPSMIESVGAGGLAGYGMQQNMAGAAAQDEANKAYLENLRANTEATQRWSPWGMQQGPMRRGGGM